MTINNVAVKAEVRTWVFLHLLSGATVNGTVAGTGAFQLLSGATVNGTVSGTGAFQLVRRPGHLEVSGFSLL
jgi:hypothetical protein